MKNGFTLLEMTVVVFVLALMTHLAVRELGRFRETKQLASADRQLEEVRAAAASFLDDVGRLPRWTAETNGAGEVTWTLSELWRRPLGLRARGAVEKEGVSLAVGWGGPYLRLPFGRDRLLDPWGNPMERTDTAGLTRLWADATGCVTNLCHYGPSAQAVAKRALTLVPDGGTHATLILTVNAGAYDGAVSCGWYAPFENGVTNETKTVATAGGQIVFENVPCGDRLIKVQTGRTTIRRVTVTGPVTQIELQVP